MQLLRNCREYKNYKYIGFSKGTNRNESGKRNAKGSRYVHTAKMCIWTQEDIQNDSSNGNLIKFLVFSYSKKRNLVVS